MKSEAHINELLTETVREIVRIHELKSRTTDDYKIMSFNSQLDELHGRKNVLEYILKDNGDVDSEPSIFD